MKDEAKQILEMKNNVRKRKEEKTELDLGKLMKIWGSVAENPPPTALRPLLLFLYVKWGF